MDRCAAAARLPESDRKDLAIQALAQSATISHLAVRQGVGRKFFYQQTRKVVAALVDAFMSATASSEVLFELIKGGMAKCRIKNLIFEGISVDETGEQHDLDVNVAYRQACLNAIEHMTKFGFLGAQAYSIVGHDPRGYA